MAHIEWSVEERGYTLNLNKNEVRQLLPMIRKKEERYAALSEKYRDIIEGGEATERDTTMEVKYDELASLFRRLATQCEDYLR